jgi:hypothetical protein
MNWLVMKIKNFFTTFSYSYTSELERYINKHQPQNTADIERLMFEYTRKKEFYVQ